MAQEREAAEERIALDEEERLRVEERLLREMAERYGRVIEAERRQENISYSMIADHAEV